MIHNVKRQHVLWIASCWCQRTRWWFSIVFEPWRKMVANKCVRECFSRDKDSRTFPQRTGSRPCCSLTSLSAVLIHCLLEEEYGLNDMGKCEIKLLVCNYWYCFQCQDASMVFLFIMFVWYKWLRPLAQPDRPGPRWAFIFRVIIRFNGTKRLMAEARETNFQKGD